jgi:hypothetical protein
VPRPVVRPWNAGRSNLEEQEKRQQQGQEGCGAGVSLVLGRVPGLGARGGTPAGLLAVTVVGWKKLAGKRSNGETLDEVSPLSQLVTAQPRVGLDRLAVAYAAKAGPDRRWGEYTSADVAHILGLYVTLHRESGIDPLLAVAQLSLETGYLTSWWAARPRRNPAGIGVTGQPGAGVSFPAWTASSRAHAGRLLAYALPLGTGSTVQRALIAEALTWRPLPDAKRGTGVTLGGLGRSWAADPDYAVKVAKVANRLLAA